MLTDKRNIETEIFQAALEALKKNFAIDVKTAPIQEAFQRYKADFALDINIYGREVHFDVDVKANITRPYLAMLTYRQNDYPHKILLATRYVNAQLAEQLRQDRINFIDTAGNVYINEPPVYVFIKGNRAPEPFTNYPQKRAFKPTGLQLLFAFLCNPGLENKPYREIANTADVALGTVGWLMRELKEAGYVLDMGTKGNRVTQKKKLLEKWIAEYPEKLRPKKLLGRYRGKPGWWQHEELDYMQAQWGGEVAAAKLTQYLKPQAVTIYTTRKHLNELLQHHRLVKDINGDVEILERFWEPQLNANNREIVHPILIYADLVATNDDRNLETAKVIYERHIDRFIRED